MVTASQESENTDDELFTLQISRTVGAEITRHCTTILDSKFPKLEAKMDNTLGEISTAIAVLRVLAQR